MNNAGSNAENNRPALFFPRTVAEAVELLDAYDGTAKVLAGGTALTLLLRQRLVTAQALVCLRDVPGLNRISMANGEVHLGALVTHTEAASHPLVRAHLPHLATAFSLVGNAQVRAAATVGGVLAEADYASDPPAALATLNAEVVVVGIRGERRVPLTEFLVGFYQTALAPDELITGLVAPALPDPAGATYLKYSSRTAEDRPCVGVAAVALPEPDGTCRELRVAVGAAAEVPQRFPELEAAAVSGPLDDAAVDALADGYAERIDPIADVRGSAWYRTEMVRVWVGRAVRAARAAAEQRATPEGALR